MITINLGNKEYSFPNKWEELTPDQYLLLVPLLNQMWSGVISLCQLRVEWFRKIAYLDDIRVPPRYRVQFVDNIYTVSRQFDFFYFIEYDNDIKELSSETRKLLRKTDPEDFIHPNSEIRYASNISYSYKPDSVWAKNLIPEITINDKVTPGWSASIEAGMMHTSLTALQFLQASDVLSMISKSGDRKDIALLISILYPKNNNTSLDLSHYEQLSDNIMYGITLNFQALISYIFTRTHFHILWSRGNNKDKKSAISTPLSEGIYSLSKAGYGNYMQIGKMPLTTYLGIMRSDMISGVRNLYKDKVKINEIAERTNLPIDLIQKMIA